MNIYEKPTAKAVEFEVVDIIATSDMFDMLFTWGKNIGSADAGKVDFYD